MMSSVVRTPLGHVDAEPLVQLVAADLGEVVALRVEEQRAEQVPRVVERRRLTGRCFLKTSIRASSSRVEVGFSSVFAM